MRSKSALPWLILGGLPFALVNFAIVPLTDWISPNDAAAALVYLWFGAICAEGGLHAVGCVLFTHGLVRRLVLGIGVGLTLFAAWAVGYAVDGWYRGYFPGDFWRNVRSGLLYLPLLAIAIQLPLWVVKFWFGWRVQHRVEPAGPRGGETFSIRDMFLATGAVALALTAARFAPQDEGPGQRWFLALIVIALATAAVSLIAVLPAVVATLRVRRLWWSLPITLLLQGAALFGLFIVICRIEGHSPSLRDRVGTAWMAAGFFLSLTGPLLVARGLGYRLVWGWRQPEVAAPVDERAAPTAAGMPGSKPTD
jgi:hypothetical protein